jgi:excisionase family DNA binding protein
MAVIEEDYVTVAEAASLLRVAPSTIRRWIREGESPAYHLGRRVGLRRNDLSQLVKPVRTDETIGSDAADDDDLVERIKRRKLTPEEVERRLAAMERAERHAKELQDARGASVLQFRGHHSRDAGRAHSSADGGDGLG